MRGLIAAAVLAVAGIVFFVLPLGFSMTALCFFALAAVCAILWILERRKAKRVWRDGLLVLTLSGMLLLESLMGIVYGVGMSGMGQVPQTDCAIVLGAQVRGSTVSAILAERLDATLTFMEENPSAIVVVSGGRGPGEDVTEAQAMYDYLVAHGADPARIRMEDQARDTEENLRYSQAVLSEAGLENATVTIITSEFHLARALFLAGAMGIDAEGMSAQTDQWICRVNYCLREVFAFGKAIPQVLAA